ncbi:MAG: hypothetical protein Q4A78_10440 [Peptostreptococcaceae bacterium]|nr:hypothetical protein [Peptostreptococcaceae bacterium]
MSYYLFGSFSSKHRSDEQIRLLRETLKSRGVFVHLDEDLDWAKPAREDLFWGDVKEVLKEHPCSHPYHFTFSSADQPCNGHDMLFPWDRYSFEELYPNGTDDRSTFMECAAQILDRTKWALQQLILYFQVREMRVFIDGGFDNTFEVVSCTLEEMFEELKRQMWETGDFDGLPKFYQIRIP